MWVVWLAAGVAIGLLLGVGYVQRRYRDRESAYRTLLEAVPLAFLLVDAADRLSEVNALAAKHLKDAEVGIPLVAVNGQLVELVRQARRAGKVQQARISLAHTGAQQAFIVLAVPLGRGQVGLFIEDQSSILQLIEQRDRWVGDAAHELKTPLTSIRLVAEMVLPRVDPAQQRWIERLLGEVHRLNLLVQELLEFSQWQAGHEKLNYSHDVDLVGLVNRTWDALEPLARERQVSMHLDSPAQVVLSADSERLYRALLNLLDNAVRYSPVGESFEVHIRSERDWVNLDIIDSGPGFPVQDLGRVFERFYRADPARARQTGGTGLGLAIVRQIVEAHKGSVEARNHPETGGAWLAIRLPVRPN